MERLSEAAMGIVWLYAAGCVLKLMLPAGNMKRSGEKAVDVMLLAATVRIVAGLIGGRI